MGEGNTERKLKGHKTRADRICGKLLDFSPFSRVAWGRRKEAQKTKEGRSKSRIPFCCPCWNFFLFVQNHNLNDGRLGPFLFFGLFPSNPSSKRQPEVPRSKFCFYHMMYLDVFSVRLLTKACAITVFICFSYPC